MNPTYMIQNDCVLVGIDTGPTSGAIAVYSIKHHSIIIHKMPQTEQDIFVLMSSIVHDAQVACQRPLWTLEHSPSLFRWAPTRGYHNSPKSSVLFGAHASFLRGVLYGLDQSFFLVDPKRWRQDLNLFTESPRPRRKDFPDDYSYALAARDWRRDMRLIAEVYVLEQAKARMLDVKGNAYPNRFLVTYGGGDAGAIALWTQHMLFSPTGQFEVPEPGSYCKPHPTRTRKDSSNDL